MRARGLIETAIGESLDATVSSQVRSAVDFVGDQYDAYYEGLRPAHKVDIAYEKEQARRQVVLSALVELALRITTEHASEHLKQTGSLVPRLSSELDVRISEFDRFSPSLRRFLNTMYLWFGTSTQQVIQEAQEGQMPHAAIWEVATEIQPVYQQKFYEWRAASKQPLARRLREVGGTSQPSFKKELDQSLVAGQEIAAGFMIEHGMVYGRVAPMAEDKRKKFERYFDQIIAVTGLKKVISHPLAIPIHEGEMPAYSRWEEGKLSDRQFLDRLDKDNLPSYRSNQRLPGEHFHPSLSKGAFSNPGFCTIGPRISRSERFLVPPQELLRQLGHHVPSDRVAMAHIFLGVAGVTATETIWQNWPEDPFKVS